MKKRKIRKRVKKDLKTLEEYSRLRNYVINGAKLFELDHIEDKFLGAKLYCLHRTADTIFTFFKKEEGSNIFIYLNDLKKGYKIIEYQENILDDMKRIVGYYNSLLKKEDKIIIDETINLLNKEYRKEKQRKSETKENGI